MDSIIQAACPYCGTTWEIHADAPYLSDQDRMELIEQSEVEVVCDECLHLHLQD